MKSSINKNTQTGFTIIEMMVSIAIFMVVITLGLTATLGMINANRKSQTGTLVISNLSLAIEAMTKTLRTAVPDSTTNITYSSSSAEGSTYIKFIPGTGIGWVEYYFDQTNYQIIRKTYDEGNNVISEAFLTGDDVEIQKVRFRVTEDGEVPTVLILVEAQAGSKQQSKFYIQSLVSRRLINTF
ncbi:MAG: type II secretion system protein [Nitrosopumilus sp.]|nr:type II secretion system protein [Nitrosopumilus sp.]MBA3550795.1 type II secretion system protein [Patescibacteria group bacterium]